MSTTVTIIGAGPAGLAAAVAAGKSGARVRLVDDSVTPGGQIWRRDIRKGAAPAARRYLEAVDALQSNGQLEHLTGTTIVDAQGPTDLLALGHGGAATQSLHCERLVLATGARERFLPFPGWTLPGVVGVGGIQALCKQGLDVRGRRIVVAGSGPLLLAVADYLRKAGAQIPLLAEQAAFGPIARFGAGLWRYPGKLRQLVSLSRGLRGIRRKFSSWPVAAHADSAGRLQRVTMANRGRHEAIDCDLLAVGFGLVPETGLAALLGCHVDGGRVHTGTDQRTSLDNVWCAGEPTGIGGVDVALAEGTVAGHAAAGDQHSAEHAQKVRDRQRTFADRLEAAFGLRSELRSLPDDDTIVCRCEDVPFGALRGRTALRDAKLKTRCGMGPCQGRVCAPALEFCLGLRAERPRPPLFPVPLSALTSSRK